MKNINTKTFLIICFVLIFLYSYYVIIMSNHMYYKSNGSEKPTQLLIIPKGKHQTVKSKGNLQRLAFPVFQKLEDIKPDSEDSINLGFIIINHLQTTEFENNFIVTLTKNIVSILRFSSGTPLHFVIITDKSSIYSVGDIFQKIFAKYVSEGVITRKSWRWRKLRGIPEIKISFADCEEIVNLEKAFFTGMKRNSH